MASSRADTSPGATGRGQLLCGGELHYPISSFGVERVRVMHRLRFRSTIRVRSCPAAEMLAGVAGVSLQRQHRAAAGLLLSDPGELAPVNGGR